MSVHVTEQMLAFFTTAMLYEQYRKKDSHSVAVTSNLSGESDLSSRSSQDDLISDSTSVDASSGDDEQHRTDVDDGAELRRRAWRGSAVRAAADA